MAGEGLLARLKPGAVVMNSSRGEVVDGDALLRSGHPCVLDVWEHEPHLDPQLLDRTLLATPHVAGYSEQGKATATAMSVATLAGFFHYVTVGPNRAEEEEAEVIGKEGDILKREEDA